MQHYSTERKESALKEMRPPNNISITKLSLDMGPANKFAAVLETAELNEAAYSLRLS